MAIVLTDDKHYKAIAGVLRESYGIPSDAVDDCPYKPSEMSESIRNRIIDVRDTSYYNGYYDGESYGVTKGKQEAYDNFWDIYQDRGNGKDYGHAFAGAGWTEQTFKPKYNIVATNAYMMFMGNKMAIDLVEHLDNLGVALDVSNATNTNYMFQATSFTRIGRVDVSGSTGSCPLDNAFAQCSNLKTIDSIVLKTGTRGEFNGTFTNCTSLEEVRMEGTITKDGLNLQWSKKLSKASIANIIGCLSTTTSGMSITLSSSAVNNAFTEDEWATLIATKPNWTISLV